ncbi:MAG TPA: lipid II flippase MurJ [Candidatus Kapabacteria bacterium]|nr:lipid II flippase MurJ [Candidatus Kapabacteria bacterium]
MNKNPLKSSSFESFLATGASVFAVTLGVKLLDALKNIISVSRFGVTAQADVYNIILTMPDLIVVAIGLDTIRGAATTYFTEYVTRKEYDKVEQLFSSLFSWGIVVAILLGSLVSLAMPSIVHLIASGFTGEKLELTITLAYIVIPILLFRIIIGILVSLLYAHNVFVRVTIFSALTSVAVIVALVISGTDVLARNAAIAYSIGFSVYVILLALLCRKYVKWKFSLRNIPPVFWEVLRFSGALVAAMMIAQIAALVEKRVASFFPDGTVASLGYANALAGQFVFLIAALFGVMQRQLSVKITQEGEKEAMRDYWQMLSYILFAVMFCAAVLVVLRYPILQVLYKRQSFDEAALARTALPLAVYALWIIGQVVSLTTTTLLLAMKRSRVIVFGSLIAYGLDICLVGVFAQWLGYVGVAVSSLLTITVYAGMLLWGLRIAFGRGAFAEGKPILRILLLGVVASVVMVWTLHLITPVGPPLFIQAVEQIVIVIGTGLLVYLLLASVLKVNYAGFFLTNIKRRFARAA